MKLAGLASTSVLSVALSFLFGTSAVTYARDQRDEAKPSQQETRPHRPRLATAAGASAKPAHFPALIERNFSTRNPPNLAPLHSN
jgi:hypothetical protein